MYEDRKELPCIREMVLDIIHLAYSEGDSSKYPTQAQISNMVRKIKNKRIDPDWDGTAEYENHHPEKPFFGSCQPSVSKHLRKLCQKHVIIKLAGNVYVPYNVEHARESLRKIITEKVSFNRGTVFVLSSCRMKVDSEDIQQDEAQQEGTNLNKKDNIYATCSLLVDVRYDYIPIAKELFRQYIGSENYYDIVDFQGKVLILLEGKNEDIIKLRKDIKSIVKETYEKENKS